MIARASPETLPASQSAWRSTLACAAAKRGRGAVANEVPSPLAAARVEEELKRDARHSRGCGDRSQLTR